MNDKLPLPDGESPLAYFIASIMAVCLIVLLATVLGLAAAVTFLVFIRVVNYLQ